jgi:conjugative transfer region protein TrbK
MMDGKIFPRLGAIIFVGVAITATVMERSSKDEEPQVQNLRADVSGDAPTLHQMLRHCRDMGEAATRDSVCLKLWADNRNHFLGRTTTLAAAPAANLAPPTPFPNELAPTDHAVPAEQPERFQPFSSPNGER